MWPVKKDFCEGLNRAYPTIAFIPEEHFDPSILLIKDKNAIVNGHRIAPIRWSDAILGVSSKKWMRTKYDLYGKDYNDWKRDAMPVRDEQKENELFNIFGVSKGQSYILTNPIYRSNFTGTVPMVFDSQYPVVEMRIIEGFSLFDYIGLIENATIIHVVNSAIFYLLEILNLSASEVHLYSRVPDEIGFPYTDYLQTKPYILHQ